MARAWTIEIPWVSVKTMNKERNGNRWRRAEEVSAMRGAGKLLIRSAGIPPCRAVRIVSQVRRKDYRSMVDIGAEFPSVKALIDALPDAGVIPGDGPEFMRGLTFLLPFVDPAQKPALLFTVEEVE